jgi:hypothetical protein
MRPTFAILTAAALFLLSVVVTAQRRDVFVQSRDHAAIRYSATEPNDEVAALNRKIAAGTATLRFDQANGYLRSVLEALNVPVESQTLVFSQTSFQGPRINIQNPRAVYFNDTVAVGWVRGGDILEVTAQDPRQGVIFYSLDQKPEAKPRFTRNDQCPTTSASPAIYHGRRWASRG